MKFNQLEAYRAVMLTGSITEGANYLHVSQPGVSRLIKDLERAIGFKLFERRPGRLVPTPEGLSFYEHVQRSFAGIQSLENAAREIAMLKRERLRIAASPAASLAVVPDAVAQMKGRFPDLPVSLEIRDSDKVLELVSSMQAHLGVVARVADYPGVVIERRYDSHCVCVMPAGHPLAQRERVTPEDLTEETVIAAGESLPTGTGLRQALSAHELDLAVTIEASSGQAICNLVDRGLGIGIADPLSAGVFLARGLVARPFFPAVRFSFALVCSEHLVRSVAVSEFAGILHAVIRKCIADVEARVPLSLVA